MFRFQQIILAIFIGLSVVIADCSGSDTPDGENPGEYPSRPIKLIVPFGAGGGTDTFARVLNKAIKDESLLPQPFVILNMGGAGATIGSRRVKNAEPDGYTVLILHDAILTAKFAGKVTYGPEEFEPVAGTGEVGMVIAVRDDGPYKTLKDLMTAAKENPKTISFGANLGALTHFAGLLLEKEMTGAKFRYVQFGGGAERFGKLMGNHIEVTGFSIEEFERFRHEGLRGLAVFSQNGHPLMKDGKQTGSVPPAHAEGFNVFMTNTFYWWVPKGTAADRIDVLAKALKKALSAPSVVKWLKRNHCNGIYVRGDELTERINKSAERYSKVTPDDGAELPNYPLLLLTGMALTGMVMGFNEFRRKRSSQTSQQKSENSQPPLRTNATWACLGITFVYFLSLAVLQADFRVMTFLFVLVTGALLARWNRRRMAILIGIAIIMSVGLEFLLSSVFDVHFS